MRPEDASTLVDWIAAALRWLALLGLAVSQAGAEGLTLELNLILLGAALLNLLYSLLLAGASRARWLRGVSVLTDLAAALGLFYFSRGPLGGMVWAGLMPLVSISLYAGLRGVLLMTALAAAAQFAIAWLFVESTPALVMAGSLAPLYFGVGVVISYFGGRLARLAAEAQKAAQQARREAERLERERQRYIVKLIAALSASLNYSRVLETAMDIGAGGLDGPGTREERLISMALLFSAEGQHADLRLASARRLPPADLRQSLPARQGLVAQAIEDGQPHLGRDLANDPELSRFISLRECRSAYCIPLRSGLDTFGALLFVHPDEAYFTAERREVLDVLANQAMIAMQNAQLYQDLELEKERIMEIQEDARKKLARDLHDGPTQSVAALAMRVNFARRLLDRDAKAAADELFKIEDLARRTTKEIRHMLFTLRPLVLESQGLVAALQSMAEKMGETYNQHVEIQAEPDILSKLEMGKQGVIFYIAEEAVNNARKHAKAPNVWVRLKLAAPDLVLLEVEDDGVGFDPAAVGASYDSRGSLGMVNMRERTELLNGALQIDSAPGKGARVRVYAPLSDEAADRLRRRN